MSHINQVELNVNDIISRSLRVIRAESAYQSENLDARQFIIDSLNDLLAQMNASGQYVPYYNVFNFDLTPGKATYKIGIGEDADVPIEHIIDSIDYVNVFFGGYRYPVSIQDNYAFLTVIVPQTTTGLPSYVRINQAENFQELNFFPAPNQLYNCQLLYKRQINYVTYQDTIVLPAEYRKFLVYWLAKSINIEGGYGTWDVNAEAELNKCDTILKAAIAVDYRVRSQPPYFPYRRYWYYGNLGVITR